MGKPKPPYKSKHLRGKYLTGRTNHQAFIPEWRLIQFSDGTAYTIQNKQLAELVKAGPSVRANIRITPSVSMTKTDRFFTFTKVVNGKEESVVIDVSNADVRELFASDGVEDDEEDEWSYQPGPLQEAEARALVAGEDVYVQESVLDDFEELGDWHGHRQ